MLLPRPPICLLLGEAISGLSLLSGYKTNPVAKEYGCVSPFLSSPPGGILHHWHVGHPTCSERLRKSRGAHALLAAHRVVRDQLCDFTVAIQDSQAGQRRRHFLSKECTHSINPRRVLWHCSFPAPLAPSRTQVPDSLSPKTSRTHQAYLYFLHKSFGIADLFQKH